MASETAYQLAKSVLAASNASGTYIGDVNGRLTGLLASQIDAAVDLIKEAGEGFTNPKLLILILAKKGLAIGGLAVPETNQVGTCMVALSGMGLSLAAVAASVPTGVGVYVTGLGLLADAYGAYDGCKGPAGDAFASFETDAGRFLFRMQTEIMNLATPPM